MTLSLWFGVVTIATGLLGVAVYFGYRRTMFPKFIDLRQRFQRLERKLESLENAAGLEFSKFQASRGPAVFEPPPGPSPFTAGTWDLVGGQGVNGSWRREHFRKTRAIAVHKDRLFVGLVGRNEGDAQVWAFDGQRWEQVGGGGINGSWKEGTNANALLSGGGDLYAAIGTFRGPKGAEVWKFSGGDWQCIGAGELGHWPVSAHFMAYSLALYGDDLFAGMISRDARAGEIYKFDGTSWLIQEIDLPAGCDSAYELRPMGEHLYAGIGKAAGCGAVYRFDGSVWEKIGGSGIRGSWVNPNKSVALSLAAHQGHLVGFGDGPGVAQVWRYHPDPVRHPK